MSLIVTLGFVVVAMLAAAYDVLADRRLRLGHHSAGTVSAGSSRPGAHEVDTAGAGTAGGHEAGAPGTAGTHEAGVPARRGDD